MEGSVAEDQSWGEWQVYAADPELPDETTMLNISWNTASETDVSAQISLLDDTEEEPHHITLSYNRNGDEFQLEIEVIEDGESRSIDIQWNIGTGTGFFLSPDGVTCHWDSGLRTVECDGDFEASYQEFEPFQPGLR
jgi:hypothetical protein